MVSMTGRTLVWVKDIVVPEAMVTVEAVVAVAVAVAVVAVAVAVPVAVVEIVAVAVQAVVEAITDALTRLSEFEKISGAPAGGDGPAPIPAGGHGDPPLLLRAGTVIPLLLDNSTIINSPHVRLIRKNRVSFGKLVIFFAERCCA
jgi:hypothetical protein